MTKLHESVTMGHTGDVDYLTSDYASDQLCLYAANEHVKKSGGGTVFIQAGTYN